MSKVILIVVLLNTLVSFAGLFYSYRQSQPSTAAEYEVMEELSDGSEAAPRKVHKVEEFSFFPVEKIIVTVPGEGREHYFVIDLALFANSKTDPKVMGKVEPLVRSSVVAEFSARTFRDLRSASIPQLQTELQEVLKRDFAQMGVERPFHQVLISKLVVQ